LRVLLIDNYDSFTYNVYQYLLELSQEVTVVRNDRLTIEDIKEMNPEAIFISPGPGTPEFAGICVPVIKEFAGRISIFGICLGHQAIGEAFGGKIVHATTLMHGKTSEITPLEFGIMKEIKSKFIATRYHSLVIDRESLPDCLQITCLSPDGEIMGVIHKQYNIEGVQFHPESIMTENGKDMIKAFLTRTLILLKKEDKVTKDIINIEQSLTKYELNRSIYSIFKEISKKIGRDKSFLLESAEGPKIDSTKTYIGLFPQFELKLKDSYFQVAGVDKDILKIFEDVLGSKYVKTGNSYRTGRDRFSSIFKLLRDSIKIRKNHKEDLMISCGLTGFFSYEYIHYIENIHKVKKDSLDLPEVHLKFFPLLLQVDREGKELILVQNKIDGKEIPDLSQIIDIIISKEEIIEEEKLICKAKELSLSCNIDRDSYLKNVETAKKYIYEGDIFQVQLGKRVKIIKDVNPIALYEKLREINPSPYMFYWDCNDYQLIGNSPELQLRIQDQDVMIRPIAGTSKGKGNNMEERERILEAFTKDIKENAEHIMLVDLARNDIGIMAEAGTVHVSQLMEVEEFSHVFHLTSTVVGKLKANLNSMEVFEATFPAGTLTGAPKVRAMEIISELETEQRGPYGGAFGFFDFNGNIISSIVIRTVVRKGEELFLQASAGIVSDSVPEAEWDETEYKMKALKEVIREL